MTQEEIKLETLYAEKTKFFTLVATNLSGKRKKINFLSDYSLNDKEVIYTCDGTEESYYKIKKEIEKNPLLIYKLKLTSQSNFYRPDLFSMNRFSLKKNMVMESRMLLPLSYISVNQFQAFVVDIPTAFGLDYASDISYVLEPNTSISVSFYCIPYDKIEHDKLKIKNTYALHGHPVWITNKTSESKVFNLFTNLNDYSQEEYGDTQFEYHFWQTKMHISGVIDNLFSKSDVSYFSMTRIYSDNLSQLENSIEFNLGNGTTKSIVPSASFTPTQFINSISDVPESFFSSREKMVMNLNGNSKNANPPFLKTIIHPMTTVCLWIELFDKHGNKI